MVLLMLITLYTSRIILGTLGFDDYGIYNIVGGVIVFFTFLNTVLSSATQRFLSFSLGDRNGEDINLVFCTSLNLHILLSIIVLILSETAGLWFVLNKLNIPEGRMSATVICYQLCVFQALINIVRVPYNSMIIAYEKMDAYAWLTIFEAVFRLAVVYILIYVDFDKLIVYSILTTVVCLSTNIIYWMYCKTHFKASKYNLIYNRDKFKEMLSFSSWSLMGGVANLLRSQGINVLLNMFLGVVVNAAQGIASNVSSAALAFMGNFQTAYSPQIVKLYAERDIVGFNKLILTCSKFSFMLMAVICIPIILNIDLILTLWLVKYPENTNIFCVLVLIASLVDSFAAPLWIAVGATGRVKNYNLILSSLGILSLPIAYIMLKMGAPASYCVSLNIFVNLSWLIVRIILLHKYVQFNIGRYLSSTLIPGTCLFVLSLFALSYVKSNTGYSILDLIFNASIAIFVFSLLGYLLLLTKKERTIINGYALKIIRKF